MVDFKITFQDDELLYGDYENMSLISKIMFTKPFISMEAPDHVL